MSQLTDLFTNIANAIRDKTGQSETISATNFPTAIANLPAGAEFHVGIPNSGTAYQYDWLKNCTHIMGIAMANYSFDSYLHIIAFIYTPDTQKVIKLISGGTQYTDGTISYNASAGKILVSGLKGNVMFCAY